MVIDIRRPVALMMHSLQSKNREQIMDKRSSRSLMAVARLLMLAACMLFTAPCSAQASGQGPITYNYDELGRLVGVTDAAGNSAIYTYDAVGNILSVARHAPTDVTIIDFTPNGGPAGAAVTISGGGFSTVAAQNDVKFNQVGATVVSSTATRIVTSVPVGASTGPISVTTPNGSATSSAPFVVGAEPLPSISQFSPSIGAAGSAVTITGTNFAAFADGNRITFNQRAAAATSASATNIATVVPANTSSGKISVATLYGVATSATDFFVPPSPYTAADIESTDRMAIGQTKTVTIAAAGKKAMVLFDGVAGQRVSMSLSAVTIAGGTLSIRAPNGAVRGSVALSTSGGFIDTITLLATGTYTILIDPYTTAKGNVTMTLNAVQNATANIAIGGAPVTITTTVPGQDASLTFSATAGQRFTMSATAISSTLGCSTFSIVKPDGTNLVAPVLNCGTSYFLDATTLPATGSYTILLNPPGANTGSATFVLRALPADVTAAIAIGGPAVTVSTTAPGQNASLIFNATAGQRLSMNITAVSPTQNCSTFSIIKPDGTNWMQPYATCGTYFFDTATVPLTGSYTIVMNPRDVSLGSATFALFEVPPDSAATITIGGPAVTVASTVPGQNAALSFSGTAGQRISLNITAISASLNCPTFSIVKPDGTYLMSPTLNCATSLFFDAATLPLTGTYTIVLNPPGAATGSATFTLYAVPADGSSAIAIGGPAVTLGNTVPGQNVNLTFSGSAGQRISMNATAISSTLSCPAFAILKPDGTSLVASNINCASSFFIDVTTLPVSGTYTIVMNPGGTTIGNATFALYEVPPDAGAVLTPGAAGVTLATTTPGQNVSLSFGGTAGQRISLNVTAIASFATCPSFSIIKPDGANLLAPTTSCSATFFVDVTTLPLSGNYTIVMNPTGASTGSANFALFEVPADTSATIAAGGAALTQATTVPGQNMRLTFSGTTGQRISLNVTAIASTISCPSYAILNPDGSNLVAPVTKCGASNFIDLTTLPQSGSYTIIFNPSGANIGSATFTLYDVPADIAATTVIGAAALTVTTTVPAQNAIVSFSGAAGQQVTVRVTGNTMGCPVFSLRKPDGSTLVSTTACGASQNLAQQVLATAGTYSVKADPSGANIGSANIAVTSP